MNSPLFYWAVGFILLCFCFSRCPAERLICPSKTREIKEKNKRFHRLKFFSFSFCRYSCCFPKSLPSLPGRAGQGIDGLVSSRKSKSSPGTFPNYCKWPRHAKSKPPLRRFPVAVVFLLSPPTFNALQLVSEDSWDFISHTLQSRLFVNLTNTDIILVPLDTAREVITFAQI